MVFRASLLVLAAGLAGLTTGCASAEEAAPNVEVRKVAGSQPAVIATVRVDEKPRGGTAVAVGEGGVWVSAGGGCSGSISHVDPESNEVVARIETGVVTDIAVGAGSVWAASSRCREGGSEGLLLRIDPGQNRVVAAISLGCSSDLEPPDCFPSDIAVNGSGAWVSLNLDPTEGEIVRIRPATNEVVARIPVEGWPRDVVLGEGSVWVFSLTELTGGVTWEGGSLIQIDPRADNVVATLLSGEIPPGGGEEIAPMIAVGAGGVWASAQDEVASFAAVRIDAQTKRLTGVPVPLSHFYPVAVDEGGVWFVGRSGERASLSHLDPRTGQVDRSVALGITPIDAALDSAGETAWVADYWPSVVRVDLH
jgi:DNA-binding beta-propeller fold protein YncE